MRASAGVEVSAAVAAGEGTVDLRPAAVGPWRPVAADGAFGPADPRSDLRRVQRRIATVPVRHRCGGVRRHRILTRPVLRVGGVHEGLSGCLRGRIGYPRRGGVQARVGVGRMVTAHLTTATLSGGFGAGAVIVRWRRSPVVTRVRAVAIRLLTRMCGGRWRLGQAPRVGGYGDGRNGLRSLRPPRDNGSRKVESSPAARSLGLGLGWKRNVRCGVAGSRLVAGCGRPGGSRRARWRGAQTAGDFDEADAGDYDEPVDGQRQQVGGGGFGFAVAGGDAGHVPVADRAPRGAARSSGGERPPPPFLSQQGGVAEGSLPREVPGVGGKRP
ncbi:hypothetical protein M2302_005855 [Micromonospora sp. A200]|nr:hypothetical protein [Micromonospora sp. A200]